MQIKSKKVKKILVLTVLEKRLDASNSVAMKDLVGDFINKDNQNIALNLSKVEFVDSSGLGALVSCLKQMGSRGRFILFSLNDSVIAMFKLTRMDRVFTLCDTEKLAIEVLEA